MKTAARRREKFQEEAPTDDLETIDAEEFFLAVEGHTASVSKKALKSCLARNQHCTVIALSPLLENVQPEFHAQLLITLENALLFGPATCIGLQFVDDIARTLSSVVAVGASVSLTCLDAGPQQSFSDQVVLLNTAGFERLHSPLVCSHSKVQFDYNLGHLSLHICYFCRNYVFFPDVCPPILTPEPRLTSVPIPWDGRRTQIAAIVGDIVQFSRHIQVPNHKCYFEQLICLVECSSCAQFKHSTQYNLPIRLLLHCGCVSELMLPTPTCGDLLLATDVKVFPTITPLGHMQLDIVTIPDKSQVSVWSIDSLHDSLETLETCLPTWTNSPVSFPVTDRSLSKCVPSATTLCHWAIDSLTASPSALLSGHHADLECIQRMRHFQQCDLLVQLTQVYCDSATPARAPVSTKIVPSYPVPRSATTGLSSVVQVEAQLLTAALSILVTDPSVQTLDPPQSFLLTDCPTTWAAQMQRYCAAQTRIRFRNLLYTGPKEMVLQNHKQLCYCFRANRATFIQFPSIHSRPLSTPD